MIHLFFSSPAQQVFYLGDKNDKRWEHVITVKPRDAYHLGALPDDDELYPQCMAPNISMEDEFRDPVNWDMVE